MSTAVATRNGNGNGHPPAGAELMEQVVIKGDLSKLTPQERGQYYMAVCRSVGLNPLTKPFEYITLNGKLTLYALRNCTDQLRSIHRISVVDMTEAEREGVCIVTCKVSNADGRTDIAKGAVNLAKLQGEALANAIMKAETKAKRRATLSICGLGLLDETEVEDIPDKRINPHVNRPEDMVDVPALDDPDRVPPGSNQMIVLAKKDARPIADKLGKELAGFSSLENLERWKNLPETANRVAVLPDDWREIFQGRVKERLMDLRSAQKMAAPPHDAETGEVQDEQPADDGIPGFLRRAPTATAADVFDGASWLHDLEGAYSGCEDAATFFEVDQKMYIANLTKALPPDRKKAIAIRQEHFTRLNADQQ